MKRDKLQGVNDQLTGGSADAPNGRNLVACINQLDNLLDEMEEWGVASATDLSAEKQAELEELHEDLQYHISRLSNDLIDVAGSNGAVEDAGGNKLLDLPKAALGASSQSNVPDAPNGN